MSENIRVKIIEHFKEETGFKSGDIQRFLTANNIKVIDKDSIIKALNFNKKKYDKIIIPKFAGYETEINPKTRKLIRVNKYENDITENEVNELKKKKIVYGENIHYLKILLSVVEMLNPKNKNEESKSVPGEIKDEINNRKWNNGELARFLKKCIYKNENDGEFTQKIKDIGIKKNETMDAIKEQRLLHYLEAKLNELHPEKVLNRSSAISTLKHRNKGFEFSTPTEL